MDPKPQANLAGPAQQEPALGPGEAPQEGFVTGMTNRGFHFLNVLNTLWPNLSPRVTKLSASNPAFHNLAGQLALGALERGITEDENLQDVYARIEAKKYIQDRNKDWYVRFASSEDELAKMAPYEELCQLLEGGNLRNLADEARVLERLYRLNVIHAKSALFTQYLRMATSKSDKKYITIDHELLRQQITRHTTSIAEYKAFMASVAFNVFVKFEDAEERLKNTETILHGTILSVAAETVAFEKFQAWLGKSQLSAQEIEWRKNEARDSLERAKEALILSLDDAIDELSEDAAKRNAEREAGTKSMNSIEEGIRQFLARLGMALFGGLALIAPMLIMVLHESILTSLLTTSVFVLVIGATFALFMNDAQPKDVVGATAAYAAVLVVFVGASGGNAGSGPGGTGGSDSAPDAVKKTSMSDGVVAGIVIGAIVGIVIVAGLLGFLLSHVVRKQRKRMEKV